MILPFTVLRPLDCLLEPTKEKVLAKHQELIQKHYDPKPFLATASGYRPDLTTVEHPFNLGLAVCSEGGPHFLALRQV